MRLTWVAQAIVLARLAVLFILVLCVQERNKSSKSHTPQRTWCTLCEGLLGFVHSLWTNMQEENKDKSFIFS